MDSHPVSAVTPDPHASIAAVVPKVKNNAHKKDKQPQEGRIENAECDAIQKRSLACQLANQDAKQEVSRSRVGCTLQNVGVHADALSPSSITLERIARNLTTCSILFRRRVHSL